MSRIGMKEMLEAGAHFGHQTERWNPKMAPYIFGPRNGIHIIDLQQTVPLFRSAYEFMNSTVSKGGKVLFVGTKKQAQDVVKSAAIDSNQFYVNHRWLGGMLTNFKTIKQSIERLRKLSEMSSNGTFERLPVAGIVASSSIVFSAAYSIYMFNRIAFGGSFSKFFTESLSDLTKREFFILFTLVIFTVLLGIYPNFVLDGLHYNISGVVYGIESNGLYLTQGRF